MNNNDIEVQDSFSEQIIRTTQEILSAHDGEPVSRSFIFHEDPVSENTRSDVYARGRAWIEIDTEALAQNTAFLRSFLPQGCRLMPAIKAEAYGHGAVIMARELNRLGVDSFCVACVSEGIDLRRAGIAGEILVLGYTSPHDFPLLEQYELTQNVVDYEYALTLNGYGKKLHVHVGVDTGMHRSGIRCENSQEIMAVYEMENLEVDGIFTHLSASDSLRPQDRAFTASQIQAFFFVISLLREQGYSCRGIHLLASYGILNLLDRQPARGLFGRKKSHDDEESYDLPTPEVLAGDYVRPGIVLYGVLSTEPDSDIWREFLHPVLSLKTRIASVRTLYAGEAAGYGLAYTAEQDMRIATLSIGYADGLPRELSCGRGGVLIDGCRAPIIGRICMDQTIVDVSHIPHVLAGDVAVIIGRSGGQEITADAVSQQCGTITNELLSRLGGRLTRIITPPTEY